MDPDVKRILDLRLINDEITTEEYKALINKLSNSHKENEFPQEEHTENITKANPTSQASQETRLPRQLKKEKSNVAMVSYVLFLCLFVSAIVFGVYASLNYHFVNTSGGFKIYKKTVFGIHDTYVDMTTMPFISLRDHAMLVKTMNGYGDIEFVPSGKSLRTFVEKGQEINAS